ncbi:MAG: hypothetical protein AB7U23_13140 [Dehalococcoidia bacterium]
MSESTDSGDVGRGVGLPTRGRRGRPTVLTDDVRRLILRAARSGVSHAAMARFAGIAPETLYQWRVRAAKAMELLDEGGTPDSFERSLIELFQAVHDARATAVVVAGGVVVGSLLSKDERIRLAAAKFYLQTHDQDAWSGKTDAEHRLDEAQAVKTEIEAGEAIARSSTLSKLADDPSAMADLGRWMARRLSGAAVVDADAGQ